MAEAGSSQHQIVAAVAQIQARASETDTKGSDRRIVAADGMYIPSSIQR